MTSAEQLPSDDPCRPDIYLHETLATHSRTLRMAINIVAIPPETMLPVNQVERGLVEIVIAHLDHAIDHYDEAVRTLKLARELLRQQAAFVE
jgi:hypothetical protein